MPNYDYQCPVCKTTETRHVDMTDRNEQDCDRCFHRLERVWTFDGRVWAPTAGGTR